MLNTYLLTEESLTVVSCGRTVTVQYDHPEFDSALQRCRAGNLAAAYAKLDVSEHVGTWSEGEVSVVNRRTPYYRGQLLDSFVGQKLIEFVQGGHEWRPLARFIENLMQNPSRRSIEQLYTFLEHKNLPITEDGHFLAYKAVRSDWMDKYSSRFPNTIGTRLSIPRNSVDDDPQRGCSYGFHVGSLQYVAGFASPGDRVLIVKVNPQDVVSVPYDCSCQKVRCCAYEVMSEYQGPLPETYVQDWDAWDAWDEQEEEYQPQTGAEVWGELGG